MASPKQKRVVVLVPMLASMLVALATAGSMEACSYDWSFDGNADGGGSSGSSGSSGSISDTGGTPPIDKDVIDPIPPDPPPLECKNSEGCPLATDYCLFPDGNCGREKTGVCTPLKEPCNKPTPATCACDGKSTTDSCDAVQNGRSDIDQTGTACTPQPGLFICPGTSGCKRKVEYCVIQNSNPGNGACKQYATCASVNVTCTCADLPKTGCTCVDNKDPPDAVTINCN